MRPDRSGPQFVVHAVYGPPRPVLVVAVTGDVYAEHVGDLTAVLDHATAIATSGRGRRRYGCRHLAEGVVIDLRRAGIVTPRAFVSLAEPTRAGSPVRLLLASQDIAITRQLRRLGLTDALQTYRAITDAVLADTSVTGS